MKMKTQFFEKINKIDKHMTKLVKKKREPKEREKGKNLLKPKTEKKTLQKMLNKFTDL